MEDIIAVIDADHAPGVRGPYKKQSTKIEISN
jgi:hypothetical protein